MLLFLKAVLFDSILQGMVVGVGIDARVRLTLTAKG